MIERESMLPISSSVLTRTTGVAAGVRPSSYSARSAKTISTSPPFMSTVPGPNSSPFSACTGISESVPSGHTVSMCPISSWRGSPRQRRRGRAYRWSPTVPSRTGRTR